MVKPSHLVAIPQKNYTFVSVKILGRGDRHSVLACGRMSVIEQPAAIKGEARRTSISTSFVAGR